MAGEPPFVIGISGASGAPIAVRVVAALRELMHLGPNDPAPQPPPAPADKDKKVDANDKKDAPKATAAVTGAP